MSWNISAIAASPVMVTRPRYISHLFLGWFCNDGHSFLQMCVFRVKVGLLPYSDIMVLAPENVLLLYVSLTHGWAQIDCVILHIFLVSWLLAFLSVYILSCLYICLSLYCVLIIILFLASLWVNAWFFTIKVSLHRVDLRPLLSWCLHHFFLLLLGLSRVPDSPALFYLCQLTFPYKNCFISIIWFYE